jgi:Transposase IS116/IS110/IS902 family
MGRGVERTFLRPHDRGLSGTETRRPSIYAGQVRTSGDLPSAPEDGCSVPRDILPFWRQERSRRRRLAIGSAAPPSEPVAGNAPDTPQTPLLQHLTEYRRRLVDEATRQKHRLTSCLKIYFPQLLCWFDDIGSPVAGALLERWPTLPQLQRVHPGTLRRFFHEHNCRSEERIQERITAIAAAVVAVGDEAVVEAESLRALSLVALLTTLRSQIALFDKRIQEVVAKHPERELFASFPSAGPVLVPRLIAAFGTQRDRYTDASEVQSLSGIAPVTERSGKQIWVHFRMGVLPLPSPDVPRIRGVFHR